MASSAMARASAASAGTSTVMPGIARMTATRRRAADIKLSREKVEHIRSSSATGKELAAQFGVHHSMISKIRTHKSWRGGSAMALMGLGARR